MDNDNHTEEDLRHYKLEESLERQLGSANGRLAKIDMFLDNTERTTHSPNCQCALCSIWRIVHTGTAVYKPSPNRLTVLHPGGRVERKRI